jgi:PAS domain S-box-containing protein
LRAIIHRFEQLILGVLRRVQPYSLAVLTPLAVFFVTQGVATWNAPLTFSLYVAAVIIGGYVGGFRAGAFATALAVGCLIWHYGFPTQTKQVMQLTDLYPVLVPFTLMSIFASYLASMSRQSVNLFSNLHGTVMSMAEGVILADERGRVAFANAAALKLTGWSQENALKKTTETVFRVLDPKTHEARKRPAVGSLEPEHDVVALLVSKDGSERLIEYTAEPLKNAKGASAGSMLLFHEAGSQLVEGEDLRQREAQFRAVASAAPVGIVVLDQNGECTFCNAACQSVAGFAPKEALGSGWTKFVDQADQTVVDQWKNAARQGLPLSQELRFRDAQGRTRWVRLRADAARSDRGQYLGHIAVFEDLAQQKDLEGQLAERKKTEEALRQSLQERDAQANKNTAALEAAKARLEEQLAQRQQAEESLRQEHGQRQTQWQQSESKIRQDSSSAAENLRKQLERAIAERKQLEEALELAQAPKESAADPRLASLDVAHKKLQQQLAEHRRGMDDLRQEHSENQSKWEDTEAKLRQELAGHQNTSQRLQKQLAECQERDRNVRQELADLQSSHDQTSEQLRRQEDSWKRRLDEAHRQHAAKHGELEEERQLWQAELTTHEQNAKRSAFLADVSRAFAATVTDEDLVSKIGSLAIPFLADACAVFAAGENGDLTPVACAAKDGDKGVQSWDRASLKSLSSSEWPETAQTLGRGKPALHIELPGGLRRELEQLPMNSNLGTSPESSVIVPLTMGGSARYLLVLLRNRATATYGADDLQLAQEYGHRAVLALMHVRRHHEIHSAHRDLAEQHESFRAAHEDLERQHRHLRRVLSSLPQSVCVIDADGNIQHMNAAAETMLGWPEDEAREWKIDVLLPEDDKALAFLKSESELARTLDSHSVLRNDRVLLRRYDGATLAVGCAIARIGTQEAIEGAVLTFHEIGEAPAVTVAAKEAPATVEMEKLLHRLTDRCGPILAKMWDALADVGRHQSPDADSQEPLADLHRQMQQLGRGLAKLEMAARVADHSLTVAKDAVDVCEVIDRAVAHLQPLLQERRHHLTMALPLFPEWVSADEACLEQAITVLLENAALYTNCAGVITLTVEHRADELWLRVKDNGQGLTPQDLPELLGLSAEAKRFWDGGSEGLGIGLALAHSLANMHGGTISVTSNGQGQGSEFVLRWPALSERLITEHRRHEFKPGHTSAAAARVSA